MDKNIRVRKGGFSGSQYVYGKREDNFFGYQDENIKSFLGKRLEGKKHGTLNISTVKKPGTLEVSMYLDKKNYGEEVFKVTLPRALRGARFCTDGIQTYFGKAVAQQKRLKLYVKL